MESSSRASVLFLAVGPPGAPQYLRDTQGTKQEHMLQATIKAMGLGGRRGAALDKHFKRKKRRALNKVLLSFAEERQKFWTPPQVMAEAAAEMKQRPIRCTVPLRRQVTEAKQPPRPQRLSAVVFTDANDLEYSRCVTVGAC